MKKLLTTLLFIPTLCFGFDTSLKGFIALDALNFEKIEGKSTGAVIGIGVLDLKVFAEQDNLTTAIKLNIDGDLSVKNNLFEEAYASYRGINNFRFSLGKGVVKFQNLHWGAVENSYLDGGSVLGTENSWRKVSSKAFLSAAYGHRTKGFLDTLTIWGDTTEIQTDESGNPYYTSTGSGTKYISSYSTQTVTGFNTSKQIGLANKIEIYRFEDWTLSSGQIYYKNHFQPEASYGFDFGLNRDSDDYDIWLDLLYGFTSKAPFENYTTQAKDEYFLQLGSAYHMNQFWTLIANTELLFVKDQSHTYKDFTVGGITYSADSKLANKSGQYVESTSIKLETAAQYKLSKSSFLTFGGLYEHKSATKKAGKNLDIFYGVYNANASAFKLASSVSFWF